MPVNQNAKWLIDEEIMSSVLKILVLADQLIILPYRSYVNSQGTIKSECGIIAKGI